MPGGQPKDFAAQKGDECDCGRRKSLRHCPKCGSARIYAYATKVELVNGEQVLSKGWSRCLSCGKVFHEREMEFCDAPPFTAALRRMKAQRLYEASKTNEFLNPQVVAKAQELAGQKPDEDIKAIAESEAKYDDQIKAIIDATNPLEYPEEIRDDPQKIRAYVLQIFLKDREEKKAQAHRKEPVETSTESTQEQQHERMSVAEQTFRKEWAMHRLAGDVSLPSVEEYVERRLKGELFE